MKEAAKLSRTRYLIEAILIGAIISVILTSIIMMLMGMFLTANYVPEVIQAYGTADVLHNEVSFGKGTPGMEYIIGAVLFVLLGGLYYKLRTRKLIVKMP